MEKKNLALALYMGAVVLGDYKGSKGGYTDTILLDFGKNAGTSFPDNQRYWSDTCLKYHLSYDWLMPVVHKLCAESGEYLYSNYLDDLSRFPTVMELFNSVYTFLENR